VAARPNLRGVRVLVVEDDRDSRDLVETILIGFGAEVQAVDAADTGLELVRSWRPEVVVSDVEMPEQSGYDFIRRVRALPPREGGLTPAVALTAYARTEDRVKTLSAGFQVHLAKPVHPEELGVAVAALTARTRP
ncbi:MAG TPA: response regulator, partial [Vicinamibacteria bacterium]|nr:response regulator [Vicinamibacteria bacterium]